MPFHTSWIVDTIRLLEHVIPGIKNNCEDGRVDNCAVDEDEDEASTEFQYDAIRDRHVTQPMKMRGIYMRGDSLDQIWVEFICKVACLIFG